MIKYHILMSIAATSSSESGATKKPHIKRTKHQIFMSMAIPCSLWGLNLGQQQNKQCQNSAGEVEIYCIIVTFERTSFSLSTSSRGNLHVLLSSFVPLILPLILHHPPVKSKAHMQSDPGQQSRGYQSMKWKKKTNPPPHPTIPPSLLTPPTSPRQTAQHLIELIK